MGIPWSRLGRPLLAAVAAVLVVVVAVLAAGPARAADGGATLSQVQVTGDRLAMTVSVGQLPPGTALDAASTTVTVGGRPVDADVTGGGTAGRPRVAVLVVDTSGSMGPAGMVAARDAAEAYVARVAADVRVGLVAFSDDARLLTPPTTDRRALRQGLSTLRSSGQTALYDGVALAVRTAGRGGAVVVLSDGADTTSRADLARTLQTVRGSGVHVSAVAFRTQDGDRGPLDQIARAGDGRLVAAAGADQLAAAFAQAATGLQAQVQVRLTLPDGVTAGTPVAVRVGGAGRFWSAVAALPALPASPGHRQDATTPIAGRLVTAVPWYASLWPVLALVFAGLLAVAVLAAPRRESAAERRQRALEVYTMSGRRSRRATVDEPEQATAASGVVGLSERFVERRGAGQRLTLALERAGSRLRPAEWLVLRVCVAIACAATVVVLTRHLVLGLLLGLVVGWLATNLWLRRKQRRRERAFADALPETLQLVASSLRTGFSLPQALDAAQQDGVDPMAPELGRALAAARIGANLEDELDQIAVRTRSEDWRWAVMAIRIQRSVGGNLAEVLVTTVRTLRERAATRRQVRALSAEGRLSAYILLGLPLLVAGVLLLFRREYLRPLWTTLPGLGMIAGALVLMGIGTWWMSKVVTVEV